MKYISDLKKNLLPALGVFCVLILLLATTACLPSNDPATEAEKGAIASGKEEFERNKEAKTPEPLETKLARRLELDIEGETYVYKRELINILLLGTDYVRGASSIESIPGSAGQSDFMLLLSIDPDKETVLPIQIDRDTVTEIKSINILGRETGLIETQICRAHNYGSSPETGAELASWAVSRLFHGIKIDHYISVSIEDVAPIVDYLGGVEMTLEEDLRQIDESFYEGAEITLEGPMVERFLRARQGVNEGTNVERMSRHRAFLRALKPKILELVNKGEREMNRVNEDLKEYYFTDMSKGRIINLAWKIRKYEYKDIVKLAGKHRINEREQVEFLPSKPDLTSLLLDNFTLGD